MGSLGEALHTHYEAIADNRGGALSLFLGLQPASVLQLFRTTSEDDLYMADQFRLFKLYVESAIQRDRPHIYPGLYVALMATMPNQCQVSSNAAFVCVAGVCFQYDPWRKQCASSHAV